MTGKQVERLEPRQLMTATTALYATGGGTYLTEFNPGTGAVVATITPPAGTGAAGVTADAVDRAGNVFVIDKSSGDVLRVDATTHAATVFVAVGTGGLSEPIALAVANNGTVVVLNARSAYAFSTTGALKASVTTPTNFTDVAAGRSGLYLIRTEVSVGPFMTSYIVQRYTPSTLAPSSKSFGGTSDDSTMGNGRRTYDVGADGKLYTTVDTLGGSPTDRTTGTSIISFGTRAEEAGGVLLINRGGVSDQIAVDATGDVFLVNNDGGLELRSLTTDTVLRHVATPAAGTLFDLPLLVPGVVVTPPVAGAFDSHTPGQLVTPAGTVSVRLRGPGSGELTADAANANGFTLVLTGTTPRSTVTVTGPSTAILEGLATGGSIGSLVATEVLLGGDLSIGGTTPLRVALGTVAGGSSLTSGGRIASLTVASWADGTDADPSVITAPTIGVLTCPGTFSADVTLTAQGPSLGRAMFGSVAGSDVATGGSIGTVTVAGDVSDSRFAANAPLAGAVTLLATFGANPARVDRFVQAATGTFSDSQIAAYGIGTVTIGRAVSTAGVLTGVAGHVVGSVRIPPLQNGKTFRHLNAAAGEQTFNDADVVLQVF